MVYWRIKFSDGTFGWQRMEDDLSDARVLDDDGNEVMGSFEYSFENDTDIPSFVEGAA
jgi:hypothetical protein